MTQSLQPLLDKLQQSLGAIKPPPSQLIFDYSQPLDPQAVVNALAMSGIALVRNFATAADMARVCADINAMWATAAADVHRNLTSECDAYVVNYELGRFKTFPDIAASPKPVFNLRHGRQSAAADAGFVDTFKSELLVPSLAPLRTTLENGLPREVASRFVSLKYRPTGFNLYINEGVTNPRDFHIDAEQHQIKAFLYLTDVLSLNDGPYCYVPGSHQETHIKALNKVYNSIAGRPWTDMSLVDPAHAIACLAPAGTLILSMQSGLHRGYPQAPGARRFMLVELFEPG